MQGSNDSTSAEAQPLEITPDSSTSDGTTVATSATPAGPPSSNGTSWRTNSASASPDQDLIDGMEKLHVLDHEGERGRLGSELLQPRAHSAGHDNVREVRNWDGNVVAPSSLQRADSDPVRAASPTRPDICSPVGGGDLKVALSLDRASVVSS